MRTEILTGIAAAALAAAPAAAQQAADAVAPEAAAGGVFESAALAVQAALAAKAAGKPVEAENWMIAAANPHAVEAGAAVLARGGSAADAMVAVQAVLGLVEPQSSGLGGGAFLVWHDGATGALTHWTGAKRHRWRPRRGCFRMKAARR